MNLIKRGFCFSLPPPCLVNPNHPCKFQGITTVQITCYVSKSRKLYPYLRPFILFFKLQVKDFSGCFSQPDNPAGNGGQQGNGQQSAAPERDKPEPLPAGVSKKFHENSYPEITSNKNRYRQAQPAT